MSEDIEYQIAKLKLEDDDILIFKIEATISEDQAVSFRKRVHEVIGENHKVIVLGRAISLAVLTRKDIEAQVFKPVQQEEKPKRKAK